MKLVLSGHFVYAGKVGGAEHMFYNMVRGFLSQRISLDILCARRTNLDPLFAHEVEARGARIVECGGEGSRFVAEQKACFLADLAADAVLFPNYALPLALPRRLGRRAAIIHDFQYCHFPRFWSRQKRAWLYFSHWHSFAAADTIFVISEYVRRDAVRLFGKTAERKAHVVPNPVSWERFADRGRPHPLQGRPYVLSVAAHYPHKQLDVLLRAFVRLKQRKRDDALVLCGQVAEGLIGTNGTGVPIRKLIAELALANDVILTGYLDDAALAQYYAHASVFAFPSVFEGFGMPAVEALGLGLPTLTTRCTAIPEATLGFATYIDRESDDAEWAERLFDMLEHPKQYRIANDSIAALRRRYEPARVAREYARLLSTSNG